MLTSDVIERIPADDFGDLLRNVPGVNVSQMSARDIQITTRGATFSLANSNLVLMDNRSLYLDFFGFVMWDYVPLDPYELKQIEAVNGPGSVVWGANAMNGVINLITRAPREMQGTSVTLGAGELGVFLQDEILLGEKVRWIVGARWDDIDPIGSVVSPRTTLMFSPSPDHTLRASYNRAFRAPSMINKYLAILIVNEVTLPFVGPYFFPSLALGNVDLTEERLDAIELGYVGTFMGGKSTFTVSVYRNDTTDSIDFAQTAAYSSQFPPPNWPLPPILLDIPPENRPNLGASYNGVRFFGSGLVNYVDEAFWTDVLDSRFWGPTDAYTQLNITLGGHLAGDGLDLSIIGQNILDEQIQQHVFGDIITRKITGQARFRF